MFKLVSATTLRLQRLLMSTSTNVIKSAYPGPIELSMIDKITTNLHPSYLKVTNESIKHAHHSAIRGAFNTTESHFHLDIISDSFEGKSLPARHRMVYGLLQDEIDNKGVHALQMRTKTVKENAH
jgi:BolA protein